MKSDDLLITLGLSSCETDLRKNWVENFKSMQRMDLLDSRMDGFCVFIPYLET